MLEHHQFISDAILLGKTYSPTLVILSILMAIFSSFTAFGISERVIASSNNVQRNVWIIFGSVTIGLGIWAMHFIGMLALKLPVPVNYDLQITVLSVIPAIGAGAAIIWVIVFEEKSSYKRLSLGGLIVGGGVGVMHFSGMMAMQMNAVMTHEFLLTFLFTFFAVVAITISLKVIEKAIHYKGNSAEDKTKLMGAIMMGFATSAMHYSAMSETRFIQTNTSQVSAGIGNDLLSIIVIVVIVFLLATAILLPLYFKNKQLFRDLKQDSEEDKARMLAFIESTPDALIQINLDGNVISWKGQSEQVFGWKESEILGQSLYRIIPPRYRESHDKGLQIFRKTGKISVLNKMIEIEALHKDGHEFPITMTVAAVEMNDGGYEFSAFINDITEGKEAELKLAEQQKNIVFQKNALDEHAIVSITDVKGNITYINDKFEQISQYSKDEVIGQTHRLLKSEHHPDSFFKEMWKTISRGDVWHGEIKNKAKDGSFYWVESTILPFLNEQGKPEQYVAIRTDISSTKAMEAKQQEVNNQLLDAIERIDEEKEKANKANKAKSEFLSSMSHELRTPLNAILGFSQLLEMDELTEEQAENVEHIISSGNHLLLLINDVLELSAIEAGKIIVSIESVALKEIVAETMTLVAPLLGDRSITVISDLDLKIKADYTKLKQVLINLISNAIKYNRENGNVTVDWNKTDKKTVKISVSDTGIGISEENKHKVFGAFNRLGQELSGIEGTGIGLVVTKDIVEVMGGKVGFDSIENEGSTFWVELPLSSNQALKETRMKQELGEPEIELDVKDKQLLYVEDNPVNIKLMHSILGKQQDCSLDTVRTGELAWDLALDKQFDLILMDIDLPGMSGIDLTHKLRQIDSYKNTPIIAVSASAMNHDIELAESVFEDYITKPIEISRVFSVLKNHLN